MRLGKMFLTALQPVLRVNLQAPRLFQNTIKESPTVFVERPLNKPALRVFRQGLHAKEEGLALRDVMPACRMTRRPMSM